MSEVSMYRKNSRRTKTTQTTAGHVPPRIFGNGRDELLTFGVFPRQEFTNLLRNGIS